MSVNTWYQCISPERLDQLISEAQIDPEAPAEYLRDKYRRPELGLWTERNWVFLHALLTFGEWAEQPLLGAAIAGGTPIGGDYCYANSPVRYFMASQVREIATALQSVEEETLRRSCNPAIFNAAHLPPVGDWHEGDFEYLWETFCNIRDFFHTAQSQYYAVLVYLC